jgi:hypothetical protein
MTPEVGQAVLACPLFRLGSRPNSARADRQASTACPTPGPLAIVPGHPAPPAES